MERLVGIDLDPTAHEIAQKRINDAVHERLGQGPTASTATPSTLSTDFYRGNYSEVEAALTGLTGGSLFGRVDGMLMDLGVSSMQVGRQPWHIPLHTCLMI